MELGLFCHNLSALLTMKTVGREIDCINNY